MDSFVIAFIPVRGGSKSIPMKNIKKFNGVPLLWYALEAVDESGIFDQVVVATDNEDIYNCAGMYPHKTPMYIYDRLTENAQDHSTTESVMLEFFEYNNYGKKDDVVLIQVTNPFLRGVNLEWLYEITYLNGGYDSALTVAPSRHFMWSSLGQPLNYNPVNRPMRQDIDPFYIENGAAYITEVGTLMTTKSRLSGRIGISKMPFYTAHELDEPEDWKILEAIQLDTQGARVAKLREYTRTFYKDTV